MVVDVDLWPEISGGPAALGALHRLGHDGVRSVRRGEHPVLIAAYRGALCW
ncbi:hypothetical protein ACU610_02945 [Geodermatophilus sp. URMC 61]|uniref:hypothetical protein n=1 Tax=Geodermatophilus sp. URMC 61 TaxID=3423411 RepID=UPI00406C8925